MSHPSAGSVAGVSHDVDEPSVESCAAYKTKNVPKCYMYLSCGWLFIVAHLKLFLCSGEVCVVSVAQ